MHQRFLQYPGDEVSFMGMVERGNVELELVGDLHKRVSMLTVVTPIFLLLEQGRRDQLVTYEPINIIASCTLRNTLPAS